LGYGVTNGKRVIVKNVDAFAPCADAAVAGKSGESFFIVDSDGGLRRFHDSRALAATVQSDYGIGSLKLHQVNRYDDPVMVGWQMGIVVMGALVVIALIVARSRRIDRVSGEEINA